MGNWVAVNKSGVSINVYDYPNNSAKIGTIDPNEVYGVDRNAGGDGFIYRVIWRDGSTGTKRDGVIRSGELETGAMDSVIDYPAGGLDLINPATGQYEAYRTFYCRRTMTIWQCDGTTQWGTVAAGQYVAANANWGGSSGDTHADWLQIGYVRNTNGQWVEISTRTGDPCDWGFIPMGLEYGSLPSTIPVYGSW